MLQYNRYKGDRMRKKSNTILITIIIVFVLIIIGTFVFIILKTINEKSSNKNYNNIASSYAPDISQSQNASEITAPSIYVNKQENPIDFKSLSDQNSDIYSWIYVPGTNVNYPVCQSNTDDNFYLDHDVYKNYSFAGAIYSQYCNMTDYSDRVTVLYGHNMADGSMFSTLHRFSDYDFFSSHKYMYVYTKDRKLTYEIVSAFEYDDRHIMNSFDFDDDKVFNDYLEMIVNPRSLYKNVRDNINLTVNDKILTLSTCLNSGEGRYLVQGVLVKDEQTK